MKTLNADDVIRKLRRAGFLLDRQAKGSHQIWLNPSTGKRVVVAYHASRDIPKKTLGKIIKQSGLTAEEFFAL